MNAREKSLFAATKPLAQRLATPSLWIDLGAVAHNLRVLQSTIAATCTWRPHIKTVKQARILAMMAQAGVHDYKCATLPECDLALAQAIQTAAPTRASVFLAMPQYGEAFLQLLTRARAAPSHVDVIALAQSPTHLASMLDAANGEWPENLGIYLDLDTGMHRSGCSLATWLGANLRAPANRVIWGIHAYDGHLQWEQANHAAHGYEICMQLLTHLATLGACPRPRGINTGGSHSFIHALTSPIFAATNAVIEVSPGTLVLGDLRSAPAMEHYDLKQAAFVLTSLLGKNENRLTFDAGSKSIAPDIGSQRCALLGHDNYLRDTASEEHLVLEFAEPPELEPGQLAWLIPAHVCTTVNLYDHAHYLDANGYLGHGKIARGHPSWLGELSRST